MRSARRINAEEGCAGETVGGCIHPRNFWVKRQYDAAITLFGTPHHKPPTAQLVIGRSLPITGCRHEEVMSRPYTSGNNSSVVVCGEGLDRDIFPRGGGYQDLHKVRVFRVTMFDLGTGDGKTRVFVDNADRCGLTAG